MAVPTKKDIEKKVAFKESLLKKFDQGQGKLTEKDMCTILRSNVRQTWMMSPIRLLKLEMGRIYDMDPTTRTKWLFGCEYCKGKFKEPEIQVDHIKGEHPLLSLSEIEEFARSILDVTLDDLQLLCKCCHGAKTYAERHGVTFEEALVEKEVLQWMKDNNKVTMQKHILMHDYGFTADDVSNETKRRNAYRQVVLGEAPKPTA